MNKNRNVTRDWPDNGIHVNVPAQRMNVDPDIREKPYAVPPKGPNFVVIRHIGNFRVKDANTGDPIEIFDPPLEITVCYTDKDIEKAEGLEHLKLGAWINSRWWILPITNKNAECPFKNTNYVGACKVLITGRWADPEVAWGK